MLAPKKGRSKRAEKQIQRNFLYPTEFFLAIIERFYIYANTLETKILILLNFNLNIHITYSSYYII